jgi:hypothetical protein
MKGNVACERRGEEVFDPHLACDDLRGGCYIRWGRGRERGCEVRPGPAESAPVTSAGLGGAFATGVAAETGAAADTVTVSSNAPSATGCPITESTLK